MPLVSLGRSALSVLVPSSTLYEVVKTPRHSFASRPLSLWGMDTTIGIHLLPDRCHCGEWIPLEAFICFQTVVIVGNGYHYVLNLSDFT